MTLLTKYTRLELGKSLWRVFGFFLPVIKIHFLETKFVIIVTLPEPIDSEGVETLTITDFDKITETAKDGSSEPVYL